jgi:hypothetical protein
VGGDLIVAWRKKERLPLRVRDRASERLRIKNMRKVHRDCCKRDREQGISSYYREDPQTSYAW